jgi:hypothetical protein
VDIEWSAVGAIGGLFSVTVAIFALLLQGWRSRIALQTDLLLKYYDRFYSPEMHKLQQTAAQQLLDGKFPNYELEDVLDYFGIIGALLERKALDHKLAYGLFDWWILRYWSCAQEYVQARRRYSADPDPEMWAYLDRLVGDLRDYRKKRGSGAIPENALRSFLEEEARSRN